MENILNYVHLRKDIPFSFRPLNWVDLLILTELSYVDWTHIADKDPIRLSEACQSYFKKHTSQEMEARFCFSKNIPNLVMELQDMVRYQNVYITHYQEVYDEEKIIQFGAVSFLMPDGTILISFRGTDGTMTGWKENMRMTYMDELPCHKLALNFLEEVLDTIPETSSFFGLVKKKIYPKIYVTGHSKGGNLAMYAAFRTQKYADVLTKILAFDAPGFRSSFIESVKNEPVLSKITNYKPKDSIIGCLLEHIEKEAVLDAEESGLLQHDAFCWKITTDSYIPVKELSVTSKESLQLVDRLLLSKSDEEKKEYIDLIFSILDRLDITNVSNLSDISLKQLMLGFLELKNMSNDERKFIFDIVNFIRAQTSSWMKTQKKS